MQTKVDIDCLLFKQPFDSGLLDPLRTRQIYQVNRCNSLNIASWLRALNIDDEDAMGTRGLIIFGRLADDSISVSDEKIVQCVFLGVTMEALKVIKLQFTIGSLSWLHLRQVFQLLGHVLNGQQVVSN